MRILILHNRYQQAGGEDVVFEAETQMLREKGHEVIPVEVNNDNINNPIRKIGAALSAVHSIKGCQLLEEYLRKAKPEILHVHNYFPMFSPSVFKVAHRYGVPTVHTLHNYRSICPSALFLRNGVIDETSLQYSAFHMIPKRVYQESYLGTAAVAFMIEFHKAIHTWERHVDAFIALSRFACQKFIQAGFPSDKIHIKPNFVDEPPKLEKVYQQRVGALFVGRLSREKGVDTLLKAWQGIDYPLTLIGCVNMDLPRYVKGNIRLIGRLTREEVFLAMSKARFLVMPSECYEGFPVTLCEAFAMKLPVIASNIGSLTELVEEGVTGYKFEPGNVEGLRHTALKLIDSPTEADKMGANARRKYEMSYTKERNYPQLMSIYEQAIEQYKR